jgi:microcompartment protein CcmL/EutN
MNNNNAWGLIETFGLVFVLEAADAMVKAADVELIGYENTASGYISVLTAGDVSACRTAVDAGVKAVAAMGAEVYSSIVIARPHPALRKITDRYSLDKSVPAPAAPKEETPPPAPNKETVAPEGPDTGKKKPSKEGK